MPNAELYTKFPPVYMLHTDQLFHNLDVKFDAIDHDIALDLTKSFSSDQSNCNEKLPHLRILFAGIPASRDGWAAADFHTRCDYKGPTVTVITSGKSIFGGYTEQQWKHVASAGYRDSTESFLFSLVNTKDLPPTQLPLIADKEESAIYRHNGCGPIFGNGHDLIISNTPNASNCSAKLNNSYECPDGENAVTFLTGSESFRVDEMDVFGFEN
ncbi:uncharacterized protein LOC110054115 [Orbicella faveolata]|uniref:uncharacterized protein LOC110054115 n=1 Tax=Orbicella faveolata TaxID=48498 RepID=UPI0009E627E0|nr:uncharacterized protein LOC110054115 [Orbicella faveolata]